MLNEATHTHTLRQKRHSVMHLFGGHVCRVGLRSVNATVCHTCECLCAAVFRSGAENEDGSIFTCIQSMLVNIQTSLAPAGCSAVATEEEEGGGVTHG